MRPGFIQPWHQLGLGCVQPWLRMRPGFIQPQHRSVAVLGPGAAPAWGGSVRALGVGEGWGGLMERILEKKKLNISSVSTMYLCLSLSCPKPLPPAFPGCCWSRARAGDEWELQTCQNPLQKPLFGVRVFRDLLSNAV